MIQDRAQMHNYMYEDYYKKTTEIKYNKVLFV